MLKFNIHYWEVILLDNLTDAEKVKILNEKNSAKKPMISNLIHSFIPKCMKDAKRFRSFERMRSAHGEVEKGVMLFI